MTSDLSEIYISIDVETAGPVPSRYSLLSIGACTLADDPGTFYIELKPVNQEASPEALSISRLSLKRSEASAILRYRKEHGDFKSIEDLLKVPGIDAAKIEAKKDRLVF